MLSTIKGKCPGLYCGRSWIDTANGSTYLSDCGACPRGYRVDVLSNMSECVRCERDPSTYDLLYLGFMLILPLILHWFFIDWFARERRFAKGELILLASSTIEVLLSAVITLLIYDPIWSLKIHSCQVTRLSDWYTLFHNPTPNYETKLYCTQEAVYPLQTMVLVFYLLCILFMMAVRPWLNAKYMKNGGKGALYSALYFIPILALFHTIIGGLIYYSFPYLSIIISMISNAAHFSLKINQKMKYLCKSSIKEVKNATIILCHWLILAYGIISLSNNFILLVLVPVPALFYIFTVKFTDPMEFQDCSRRGAFRD